MEEYIVESENTGKRIDSYLANLDIGLSRVSIQRMIEEGKMVIYPIVFDSDLLGSLILVSNDNINNIVNNSKILNNLIKSIVSKE